MSKSTKTDWQWPTSTSKISRKTGKKPSWAVALEEDPETGELVMPIPDEVIAKLGWVEGDSLDWQVDKKTGKIVVSKVKV